MQIDIVTVLPEMVRGALEHSIIKRAVDAKLVTIRVVNLRDFTSDRHKTTDDAPYGGGGGMVMKVEPIAKALLRLTANVSETDLQDEASSHLGPGEQLKERLRGFPDRCRRAGIRVVLTDPRGPRFDQATAKRWAAEAHLILLCGHYEGVDDRVRQNLVTDEASIGDFVLTGGELPALVIVDAVTRLQPGALGDESAPEKDSFSSGLLEYPHYTRPRKFAGWQAPDILLCGHHAEIERWRRWHQLRDTQTRRPDLFDRMLLSPQDQELLQGSEPMPPADAKSIRRNGTTNENNEDTDGTGI